MYFDILDMRSKCEKGIKLYFVIDIRVSINLFFSNPKYEMKCLLKGSRKDTAGREFFSRNEKDKVKEMVIQGQC